MLEYPLIYWSTTNTTNDITYFWKSKIKFPNEYIEKIEKLVEQDYTLEKGRTGIIEEKSTTDSYETNNRDIAYIDFDKKGSWIYEFLFPIAKQAGEYYNFDIDVVTDKLHYVIYPENGGHLMWHQDIAVGRANMRKLAMTVQLSDPSEYEGGDFEMFYQGKIIQVPREKGDIIVFPTYTQHRVTPITRGQRKALVFWTGGRPFR